MSAAKRKNAEVEPILDPIETPTPIEGIALDQSAKVEYGLDPDNSKFWCVFTVDDCKAHRFPPTRVKAYCEHSALFTVSGPHADLGQKGFLKSWKLERGRDFIITAIMDVLESHGNTEDVDVTDARGKLRTVRMVSLDILNTVSHARYVWATPEDTLPGLPLVHTNIVLDSTMFEPAVRVKKPVSVTSSVDNIMAGIKNGTVTREEVLAMLGDVG